LSVDTGPANWEVHDVAVIGDLNDPRRLDPPTVGGERELLEAWLDFHRMTLVLKCEGLDGAGRTTRPVATSKLSLHGLLRHMAEVERHWFVRVLTRVPDTPPIYLDPAAEEPDLLPSGGLPDDDATWREDRRRFEEACAESRRIAAGYDLEAIGSRRGEPYSLRWIYLHMIEEYARHNGHADILRELVDGETGC
jgi:uncharacterized damage-inducible protein DinB